MYQVRCTPLMSFIIKNKNKNKNKIGTPIATPERIKAD
jgi:hypothetical protein